MAIQAAWDVDAAERNPWAEALIADLSGGLMQAGSAAYGRMFSAPWTKGGMGLQTYFRTGKYKSCNSFEAGTLVVMADGTTKKIEDIEAGENVLSINSLTGEVVTAIVPATTTTPHQLRDLVRLGLDTDDDDRPDSYITATAGHAFWVFDRGGQSEEASSGGWAHASDIKEGDSLQDSAGRLIVVAAVREFSEGRQTHNLAVAETHSYYVLAGQIPVLVHNQDAEGLSLKKLSQSEAKRLLGDVHEFKMDILGRGAKIAHFDVYVDTNTGNPYLNSKNGKSVNAIPTGTNRNGSWISQSC